MKKQWNMTAGKAARRGIALLMALSVILTGCSMPFEKKKPVYTPKASATDGQDEQPAGMSEEDAVYAAMEYMKAMTLEQKVGQLFVVNLEQLDPSRGDFYEHHKLTKGMKATLASIPVGGVILFSRNIAARKQTKRLLRRLQKNSQTPLFTMVDEEGGDVARIANNPKMHTTVFPSAEEIGEKENADYVYNMGETIAEEIGKLGFNVDLAPVADVKTSELNREIGSRSFGDDPDKVSEYVSAFIKGAQSQNICTALKHFPGQGSSTGDTHVGSVDIDSSISRLRKIDFKPFEAGMEAGADFIMVSHISVSKVTETSEPASMSDLIMTTIIRDELGYEGLIITDALDMASITDYYSAADAAYETVKSGADIVLMPQNLQEAYTSILTKVQEGSLDEKRLEDSVLRILKLKFMRGIMTLEDLEKIQATPAPETVVSTAPAVTAKAKSKKK